MSENISFICKQNEESKFHTWIKPSAIGLIVIAAAVSLVSLIILGLIVIANVFLEMKINMFNTLLIIASVIVGIVVAVHSYKQPNKTSLDDVIIVIICLFLLPFVILIEMGIIPEEITTLTISLGLIFIGGLIAIGILIVIFAITYLIGKWAINTYCQRKENDVNHT